MLWLLIILFSIGVYLVGYRNGFSNAKTETKTNQKFLTPKRQGLDNYHEKIPEPAFFIEYCDAEGEITKRQITPLWDMDRTAFRAWCYLRHDERTFRNERILRCIDLTSEKEIIDLKEYLGWYEDEDEY